MKSVLYFLILVWQLVGSPISATVGERKDHDDVIVHYLDFDYHTYVPVTEDLVEKLANCRFVLSADGAETHSLLRVFDDSKEGDLTNDLVNVKLKIVGLWEETIFVDAEGGVKLEQSGLERWLTFQGYRSLRNLMESLAEQYGCRRPLNWEPDDQPEAEPQ